MADATHKWVGSHAQEIAGVMYAPGEVVTLTKEQTDDLFIRDCLENGTLLSLKGGDNKNA